MKHRKSSQLVEAIGQGDLDRLTRLLKQDPSLAAGRNEDGVSFVLLALYRGHTDMAECIAAAKAELDVFEAAALGRLERVRTLNESEPGVLDGFSPDGFTALHLAAFFGRLAVVRYLLANGGDVEATAANDTAVRPLHSAAASRSASVVRAVLAAGADPDSKQTGGHTALHSAVLHDNVPMATALLAAGADPGVANEAGRTARDFATERGHEATGRLIDWWARPNAA